MPKSAIAQDGRRTIRQRSGSRAPLYLQLTNMYAPAWGYGGPVRLMFDYAQWLSRDFEVAVFTGDAHHNFTRIAAKSERINGVSIYRHKLFFPKLARKSIYLLSPLMLVHAARHIRSGRRPAIVHFSELRGLVALYALFLKLLFGKRVTLVHSAFGSLHYKRGWRRRIYDALFMKAFIRLVDLRLAQNEHELDAYYGLFRAYGMTSASRVFLFPLHLEEVPCDPSRFTESGKNRAAVRNVRRAYGVPEDALVFLFLGRLHPAKGILRMIDAFVEFSRSCSRETWLLIVGRDDGFQAQTEEYIRRNGLQDEVRIVNNVYDGRFDYYFLADVFLGFPTIFEETMLASIEAMACGTPILVSREADIPFVEKEHAGMVIEFGVRRAAEALAALTQDLTSFQGGARRVAAKHFMGSGIARKLGRLFRKAISSSVPPEGPCEPEESTPTWAEDDSCIERAAAVASQK